MADVTTEIALEYSAKMGELVSELKKLPGISDKEVSKTTKLFDKRMREATKAAKRAADANRDSWKGAGQTAEGFKRIADAAGGSAAGYAGQIEHLTRSALALGETLGPAGVAAVAAGVALGGLVAAGAAAALQMSALVVELDQARRQPVVTKEQIQSAWALDAAVLELQRSSKELVVVLGAEFAPALTTVVQATAAVITETREWIPLVVGVGSAVLDVVAAFTGLWALDIPGRMDAIAASHGKVVQQVDSTSMAYITLGRSWKLQHDKIQKGIDERNRKWAAHQALILKGANEQARALETISAAESQLSSLYESSYGALLEGEDKIRWAYAQRIAQVDELASRGADLQLAEATSAALAMARDQELLDFQIAASDQAAKAWIDAEAQKAAASRASAEARRAAELKLQADIISASASTATAVIGSLIQIAETNAQVKENMSSAEKAHARQAFATMKALSILQAGILGAVAIMQGFAQMGPIAGAVAAVGVGAMTAAQIAVIASKQPPEFALGGMVEPYQMGSPDHTRPVMTDAEAVMTRRGVNALGGPEGVEAANRGEQVQPIELVMQYKQHILDRVLADNLLRGGPLDRRIRKAGRRTGHRRSTT